MKKILLPVPALCAGVLLCLSLRGEAPSRLTTDLAEHTDRVWIGGYPSQVTLEQADKIVEPARFVTIGSRRPSFGWQVNDSRSDVMQTACRILLASSPGTLATDSADLWDSGVIPGDRSVAVSYAGKTLEPGKIYYWKVMTFNNGDPQPWSAVKAFRTADSLTEYATPAYPLEKTDNGLPKTTQKLSDRLVFADFGYDAFGQLRLTLCSHAGGDTVTVRLGECLKDGRIDPAPGGSRRFLSQRLALLPGIRTYTVKIPADARNTGPQAVRMPDYIGEVYPFRYCEIEGDAIGNGTGIISRQVVNYPFDDLAAEFASSDTTLNQVWELCKYSIKATSFAGLYVDGDRERIPYEADALINQLSHYCVDREYTMARRSHEYLLGNATWPTEWILQSVLIAWYDYLYTGDLRAVKTHYETLKNKTLTALSGTDGFVSLTPEKLTPELYASINLRGQTLKNIVDWPHTGILGLGKAEGGETDGFVFRDVNTVVNAYHYCALELMARMAGAAGESEDSAAYARAAGRLADNFNKQLFNKKTGAYRDGIGTDHCSLHANMFPLCFGLADAKRAQSVADFVKTRGMACSVYGSQFLMDALYEAGEADYALQLLTSDAERSWYNMIRVGSTISLEAWDDKYKPNQDWNHAWGAAPANIVPRRLMGVVPTEPGFSRIEIRPQPAGLEKASLRMPTIRGDVETAFENTPGRFTLTTVVPANVKADVYLPLPAGTKNYDVTVNGQPAGQTVREGNFIKIADQGSGKNAYILNTK